MTTWTTKDGQEIPVADLADSHLWNILRMLVRGAENNLDDSRLVAAIGESSDFGFDIYNADLDSMSAVEFVQLANEAVFTEAKRRGFDWRSKVQQWLT